MVLCGTLMDRICRHCELKIGRNFQWIRPGRRRCQINPPAAVFRPGSAPPGQGLLGDARVSADSAPGACGALSHALSRKAGAKCGPFSVAQEENRLYPSKHQRTLPQVAHSARARSNEPQKVAYSAWGGQQSKVDHEGRSVKHWYSAKRDELFALNWPLSPGVAYNRPHWVGLGRHPLRCQVHARTSNSVPDPNSRPKW
jgi:hypothetical protein